MHKAFLCANKLAVGTSNTTISHCPLGKVRWVFEGTGHALSLRTVLFDYVAIAVNDYSIRLAQVYVFANGFDGTVFWWGYALAVPVNQSVVA